MHGLLILQGNCGSSKRYTSTRKSTGPPYGKSAMEDARKSDSTKKKKRFVSPLTISPKTEPRTQSAPPTPCGAPAPFRSLDAGSHKPDNRQASSCADVATPGTTRSAECREPPKLQQPSSASFDATSRAFSSTASISIRECKSVISASEARESSARDISAYASCEDDTEAECSDNVSEDNSSTPSNSGVHLYQHYHSDPFPVRKEKSDASYTNKRESDKASSTENYSDESSPPCDVELSGVEQLAISNAQPATCMSAGESAQQQVLKEEPSALLNKAVSPCTSSFKGIGSNPKAAVFHFQWPPKNKYKTPPAWFKSGLEAKVAYLATNPPYVRERMLQLPANSPIQCPAPPNTPASAEDSNCPDL